MVAVKWIRALLNGVQGNMVRAFGLDLCAGAWPFARMVFDASTEILCWFATKFDDVDAKAIGIQFGDSASQQVAEALAVLLGVCAWLSIWLKRLPICHDHGCEHAHTESASCCGGQGTCVDLI